MECFGSLWAKLNRSSNDVQRLPPAQAPFGAPLPTAARATVPFAFPAAAVPMDTGVDHAVHRGRRYSQNTSQRPQGRANGLRLPAIASMDMSADSDVPSRTINAFDRQGSNSEHSAPIGDVPGKYRATPSSYAHNGGVVPRLNLQRCSLNTEGSIHSNDDQSVERSESHVPPAARGLRISLRAQKLPPLPHPPVYYIPSSDAMDTTTDHPEDLSPVIAPVPREQEHSTTIRPLRPAYAILAHAKGNYKVSPFNLGPNAMGSSSSGPRKKQNTEMERLNLDFIVSDFHGSPPITPREYERQEWQQELHRNMDQLRQSVAALAKGHVTSGTLTGSSISKAVKFLGLEIYGGSVNPVAVTRALIDKGNQLITEFERLKKDRWFDDEAIESRVMQGLLIQDIADLRDFVKRIGKCQEAIEEVTSDRRVVSANVISNLHDLDTHLRVISPFAGRLTEIERTVIGDGHTIQYQCSELLLQNPPSGGEQLFPNVAGNALRTYLWSLREINAKLAPMAERIRNQQVRNDTKPTVGIESIPGLANEGDAQFNSVSLLREYPYLANTVAYEKHMSRPITSMEFDEQFVKELGDAETV
jgi:hypothetical protein